MIWLQVLARRMEGENSQEIFPVPSASTPIWDTLELFYQTILVQETHSRSAQLALPGAPGSSVLALKSLPQATDSGSQVLADLLY